MDYQELSNGFENLKNNYPLGITACSLFNSNQIKKLLQDTTANFGEFSFKLDQVTKLVESNESKNLAITEFLKSHYRAYLKEGFELIQTYCRLNGITHTLHNQDWFLFAKIVRNTLSHDYYFNFDRVGKEKFPIS